MSKNLCFSIFGAKKSKNGKRINITIVNNDSETKTWGCISLDPNNKNAKTQVKIKDGFVVVKTPMLEDKVKEEEAEPLPF